MDQDCLEQTSLYNRRMGSDKEYHVFLCSRGEGFVVNTLHGPRGRATVAGTKTPEPVAPDRARAIYERVVKEKIAGGYTRDESGVPRVGSYTALGSGQAAHSGWEPALLQAAGQDDLQRLLDDPQWILTEKMDGERRGVRILDGADPGVAVVGMNRRGLQVPVPLAWCSWLQRLPAGTILDGEHVGQSLFVFDIMRAGSHDLASTGYRQRLQVLRELFQRSVGAVHEHSPLVWASDSAPPIRLLSFTDEPEIKRAWLDHVRRRCAEGVVFRHAHSLYEPGRSSMALKYKLLDSSSCIVTHANEGRRSVGLAMIDDAGALREVGNVTIPAGMDIPVRGCVVEVRYMHLNEGGALYQPVYLGQRVDVLPSECLLSQVVRVRPAGHPEPDAAPDEPPPRPRP